MSTFLVVDTALTNFLGEGPSSRIQASLRANREDAGKKDEA